MGGPLHLLARGEVAANLIGRNQNTNNIMNLIVTPK